MILRHKIIFTLILFAGFIFRFWQLDQYPPSLNWDEISHGYNAYSLLKTGKDQWDTSWPIFNFRAYGDYPTTVNMYLTIPFISIFGLNPITTRLPTAILGYLLIPISQILTLCRSFSCHISLDTIYLPPSTSINSLPFLFVTRYFPISSISSKKQITLLSHSGSIFLDVFFFCLP
ncbi:MAG: hypothetical protein UT14_C0004G0013 [Candidatus Shapirobacteria bacterium GW2011_GWE1_38_92]|uniref:Glycosyltransferase RgtA/B/C/D-like domain-containing protein n=1 Tax=Candidatus Shapirobacteria bacterium GW2011_GWE1_38_92 TaxID=1618489 RepID=A0A0G0P3F6_9BACT|nr:MAG: hypothetical protein UT14_C0004G0013 [Candidatus Shapirobacteria bacterium GW2011_GWE1_38_92]